MPAFSLAFKVNTCRALKKLAEANERLHQPREVGELFERARILAEEADALVQMIGHEIYAAADKTSGVEPPGEDVIMSVDEMVLLAGGLVTGIKQRKKEARSIHEIRKMYITENIRAFAREGIGSPTRESFIAKSACEMRAWASYMEESILDKKEMDEKWNLLAREASYLRRHEDEIYSFMPDITERLMSLETIADEGSQTRQQIDSFLREHKAATRTFFEKAAVVTDHLQGEAQLHADILQSGEPHAILGLFLADVDIDWEKQFKSFMENEPTVAAILLPHMRQKLKMHVSKEEEIGLLESWLEKDAVQFYHAIKKFSGFRLPNEFTTRKTRGRIFQRLLDVNPGVAYAAWGSGLAGNSSYLGEIFKAYLRKEQFQEALGLRNKHREKLEVVNLSPLEWKVWIEGFLQDGLGTLTMALEFVDSWPVPEGGSLNPELVGRWLEKGTTSYTRMQVIRKLVPYAKDISERTRTRAI